MNSARLIFLVIFIVGSLLSFLAFHMTLTLQDRHILVEQERLTQQTGDALVKALEINQENLAGIERLFLASTHVDRGEFKVYVQDYLKKYPSIQALEWIPRVPLAERAEFESRAAKDGYRDFRVREQNAAGKMVPVSKRPEYFPVFYLEPLRGNESALGFDLGSNPKRLASLVKARETGSMQATASITLVQEKAKQQGFLIFAPIFKQAASATNSETTTLLGFSLGVFRIGDLVDSVIQQGESDLGLLLIKVSDTTDADNRVQLYDRKNLTSVQTGDNSHWKISREITFAGRNWTLTSEATPEFLAKHRDITHWTTLLIGIILTLLLGAYLYVVTNGGRRVKELVSSRTHQLQTSQSRMQAILENAVSAIITIDDKGGITMFNPAAEIMFGYSMDEVMGQNVKMLMPEPYQSEHDGYLDHHLATGKKKIIGMGREVVGLRKDGAVFPMILAVGEAHTSDTNSFVGIITDITERKQSEQKLIEAKYQAEAANRHKSAFLNVMSHELRTPLTVILGYLPMLKSREKLPEPTSIVQIAEDMDITGQHLLELINDLLDISKIEAGEMTLHPEQIEVLPILAEMEKRFKQLAYDKGIELHTESEEFKLTVDLQRLRQVLINLIGNALKFTHAGEIRITAREEPDSVIFSVADTGIGIPEHDLPNIFDAFRQVDDSSTRKAGGSGLGLAITKRLVELHGGEVKVESEYGEWTRFTFSIKQQE